MKNNNKIYILILLAIVTAVVGYVFHTKNTFIPKSDIKQPPQKTTTVAPPQLPTSSNNSNPKTTAESSTPAQTVTPNVQLFLRQDGNNVVATTKLYHISSGECSLEVNNRDKLIELRAQVIFQQEFSTCAGFSIPVSSLGAGAWSVTLNAISNNTTYTSQSTLEIK